MLRIGDNMRHVAVTEGDKVSAQIRFGWEVNTHGIGDLVAKIAAVSKARITKLCALYQEKYRVAPELSLGGARHQSLRDSAAIELGLRALLDEGGFTAFTTTFEDLHGLKQLPGLAVQRLMEDGYGFAGECDWKTAALTRIMKVMAHGTKGRQTKKQGSEPMEKTMGLHDGEEIVETNPAPHSCIPLDLEIHLL